MNLSRGKNSFSKFGNRQVSDFANLKSARSSLLSHNAKKNNESRIDFFKAKFKKDSAKTNSFSDSKKPPTGKQSKGKAILKRVGIIFSLVCLFGFLFGVLFLIGLVSAYSKNLPNIDKYFAEKNIDDKESIIVDRNGQVLYKLQDKTIKERIDKLDDVPLKLRWAFLAAEDSDFYNHKGVNLVGLSRALLCTVKNHGQGNCGGGSSITQQLVKQTTGQDERSLERKAKEAILAMNVEQHYSKDYILEFYLNIVPQGGQLEGVKTGSKYLFGQEDLNKLSLAQMAYLAAIPNQPSILSPWGDTKYNIEKSQARAKYVLDRMLALNQDVKNRIGVTDEEIKKARDEDVPKVTFLPKRVEKKAGHYVDQVLKNLDDMYGDKVPEGKDGHDYLRGKGWKVTAAVDLDTQNLLQDTIRDQLGTKEFQTKVGAKNAAGVIIDPKNGEVLAMVGSKDYNADPKTEDKYFSSKFNSATAERSMGSTMKPILYMTSFIDGYNPGSIVPDIRLNMSAGGPAYYPRNYSGKYSQYGQFIPMRAALKWSLNMPAVATFNLVGGKDYADTYVKLNSWEKFRTNVNNAGPASPLGAANMPLLEQTHAFATLANEGIYYDKKFILTIQDDKGNIVVDNKKSNGKQVVDKKYTFLVNNMNLGYNLFTSDSFLKQVNKTMDFGGKTGTGDNDKGEPGDVAFIGYSPTIAIGMWAGNNCGNNECPLIGGSSAVNGTSMYQNLYKHFLQKYLSKIKPARFTAPAGVRRVQLCSTTGRAYSEDCTKAGGQAVSEWTADTSMPKQEDMIKKATITTCGSTDKLARDIDRNLGLAQDKFYFVYQYPVPRIQSQINAFFASQNSLPPTETCDLTRTISNPKVTITSPASGSVFKPGDTVNITATITSDLPLQKVEFYLDKGDGNGSVLIQSFTAEPYSFSYIIPASALDGTYTITVIATDTQGAGYEGKSQATFKVKKSVGPTVPLTP